MALTHSSTTGANYERLEFLGDRVLSLVVADLLYSEFPNESEGMLALRHAQLVNKKILAQIARNLKIDQYLTMARGERRTGGAQKDSLLSDVCEAVIGAIFVDGGYGVANDFVRTVWKPHADANVTPQKDAKSLLQEKVQARGLPAPSYEITRKSGPDHAPVFWVEVRVDGFTPVEGEGPSKRAAEQKAAETFLEKEAL